ILANLKLIMVGQYPRSALWRVWASVAIVAGLIVAAIWAFSQRGARGRPARRVVTLLWLASPIVLWILLRGVGDFDPLPEVETRFWGGLLLTLALTVFAIVVSFPLGIVLALGRRSRLPGIPAWIAFPAVLALMAWGLYRSTQPAGSTPLEKMLNVWPAW